MEKRELKKEVINLNDDTIKRIRKQLESEELSLANAIIMRDSLANQIKFDLPMRMARLHLRDIEADLPRIKNNIGALQKQIRTKQIIRLVPKK